MTLLDNYPAFKDDTCNIKYLITLMIRRIKSLPPLLANQIAAGEVIERPSAIIKELLENALDANATKIHIDLENGGIQLLRVRDNGSGIHQDDLPLALKRHATSKIYDLNELYDIHSLGFRGEALASIAAISRLSLTTRFHEAEDAYQVCLEGKDLNPNILPASHPIGTTVEVRDIFYNVPARRKFLRSPRSEFLHIEDMVKKLALSRFETSFMLTHNKKTILNLAAISDPTQYKNRLQKIFGKAFVEQSYFFDIENQDLRCRGWFGTPTVARSQTDEQFFYINHRSIRDKLINHALKEAYQAFFPEGRHPCYAIYLDMPNSLVDVNVHPTKHEVRFKDPRLIHDFLVSALTEVLTGEKLQAMPLNMRDESLPFQIIQESEMKIFTNEPVLKIVKQYGSYLLSEYQNEWIVIDNLAYHQALVKTACEQISTMQSYPLLIPITVTLSEKMQQKLLFWQPYLKTLKIEYHALSDNTLIIRKLPKAFHPINFDLLFAKLSQKYPSEAFLIESLMKTVKLDDNLPKFEMLYNNVFRTESLENFVFAKKVDAALLARLF